jgi:hypothetical protein
MFSNWWQNCVITTAVYKEEFGESYSFALMLWIMVGEKPECQKWHI